jgi:hypothetical protein
VHNRAPARQIDHDEQASVSCNFMTAEEISLLLKSIHDIRQDTLITEITVLVIAVIWPSSPCSITFAACDEFQTLMKSIMYELHRCGGSVPEFVIDPKTGTIFTLDGKPFWERLFL